MRDQRSADAFVDHWVSDLLKPLQAAALLDSAGRTGEKRTYQKVPLLLPQVHALQVWCAAKRSCHLVARKAAWDETRQQGVAWGPVARVVLIYLIILQEESLKKWNKSQMYLLMAHSWC